MSDVLHITFVSNSYYISWILYKSTKDHFRLDQTNICFTDPPKSYNILNSSFSICHIYLCIIIYITYIPKNIVLSQNWI